MPGGLFLFFLDFHGFKILSLEDLTAVQAFHVIHAVSPGDDLGAGMVTNGLHNQWIDEIHSNHVEMLVKPPWYSLGTHPPVLPDV